jgi:hypothetical protein
MSPTFFRETDLENYTEIQENPPSSIFIISQVVRDPQSVNKHRSSLLHCHLASRILELSPSNKGSVGCRIVNILLLYHLFAAAGSCHRKGPRPCKPTHFITKYNCPVTQGLNIVITCSPLPYIHQESVGVLHHQLNTFLH